MLFLVLMLPPKPRPRLPMQSGHGSAPPASGVVHGHPDRWCSRHCRRPSRALRRVCAVSTAARQFDVQPVFAALAICSRCETRLIPEQRWPVQPPASSVSCSRVMQPATSPSPCRTSASAGRWAYGCISLLMDCRVLPRQNVHEDHPHIKQIRMLRPAPIGGDKTRLCDQGQAAGTATRMTSTSSSRVGPGAYVGRQPAW